MRRRSMLALAFGLVLALVGHALSTAQTPKRGGVLNSMASEDPPGLSIPESSTINSVWPLAPCYSNLVMFDPLKPQETAETVVPELAERWSWQDGYRNLVFFLRKTVRWHDGQPFTAPDVKYTFDIVREAKDAPAIDLQSQELDRAKRQKLVWDIERKLEADVARPMLAWRKEYFTQWPRVKNLVPHNSLYNYARMQEVWLDR